MKNYIIKFRQKLSDQELFEYFLWKLGLIDFYKKLTKDYWRAGKNYIWISPYISNYKNLDQKSIVEIGSRDALDTIYFLKKYGFKKSYIFEPSHTGIFQSIKNINKSKYKEKIIFYPFALGNNNELRTFYEVIGGDDSPNIGASGFYHKYDKNNFLKYFVPTYTINEIFSKTEDDFFLALIDVEGAEYEILEGQGAFFKKFNYIAIESTLSTPEYPNFENLKRLNLLLEDFGFDLISSKDKELTSIEEIIIKKNSQLGTKLESNTIDLIYLNNFL